MSEKYDYVRIDKKNRSVYESWLHSDVVSGSLEIGIIRDGEPFGAMAILIDNKTLTVLSVCLSDKSDQSGKTTRILKSLAAYVKKLGLNRLECRYIDDTPGITEQMLRDAGFTDFKEDLVVYRTDAYTLGSLLKAGPDAELIRGEAVRIMETGIVKCFTEIDRERIEPLGGLLPREDLSFMTLDRRGRCLSYVVISELPDGGLFLADLVFVDGREADAAGLMYMALGKVFMEIEPDGEFYIAAAADRYKRLADYVFAPVKPQIHKQRLITAGRTVDDI